MVPNHFTTLLHSLTLSYTLIHLSPLSYTLTLTLDHTLTLHYILYTGKRHLTLYSVRMSAAGPIYTHTLYVNTCMFNTQIPLSTLVLSESELDTFTDQYSGLLHIIAVLPYTDCVQYCVISDIPPHDILRFYLSV